MFVLFYLASCGSEGLHNPGLPGESASSDGENSTDTSIFRSEVGILNDSSARAIATDLPVDSINQVIYTPAEEVQKVSTLVNCTGTYQIPATSNPFLAGMPANATITYPGSVDKAPAQAPVQLVPTDSSCFQAGRALYFRVDGKIAFGDLPDQSSNADGIANQIVGHSLGTINRIADVQAPINSLIGVFLDASAPDQRSLLVPNLDFGREGRRNFKSLSPQVGQIFFIGDGKDSLGTMQAFMIPAGATRLYIAIMDQYEWNNNLGKLSVSASWLKP